MPKQLKNTQAKFGTLPVYLTAVSTILGAILFLRFGYAIAHIGFLGTMGVIIIGHLVTIPTALAVAEIATNQKVEGGGAYYIISRSFGLNIGASIGIALFLSQAISVAFYIIAFSEAFSPIIDFIPIDLTVADKKKLIGLISLTLLSIIMLTKGANVGMQALYIVVAILFVSLAMFFMGDPLIDPKEVSYTATIKNPDSFFYVFTIIFPAFTGLAAGLGLSGDLKNPRKSIPQGTLLATFTGLVVYSLVAYKLVISASPDALEDQLIMQQIAVWGPIIPIGLACASLSSALGSIMVAPRTLQALGVDDIFPQKKINRWFSKGKKQTNEPINSSIIAILIAYFFVAIGDVNFVAEIISMFFMVTYGSICIISFLNILLLIHHIDQLFVPSGTTL